MTTVYKLSNLLQDVLYDLGQLTSGIVTSGGEDFIIDTLLIGSGGKDNVWNNGALFITEDAAGAEEAPEGEFKVISAYDDSTGKLTGSSNFTVEPAIGDIYAYSTDYYPLQTMIGLLNKGLQGLKEIILVDTVTLDTAGNKTEYAAKVEWKRRPPTRIDFQMRTNDANDNRWEIVTDWEFIPAAPGSAGLIVFGSQPVASRDIRVWYYDAHPRLSVFSDPISETIPSPLASAICVERALRWQNSRLGGGDKFLKLRWNDAKIELKMAKENNPIWRPNKRSRSKLEGLEYNRDYSWVKYKGER